MTYLPIENNKEHIKTLIKWMIDEVLSASGDGDGIWYSKYYSLADIEKFITDEKLLPEYWTMENKNDMLHIGENQEWLSITNSKHHFDTRPEWQQVAVVY